MPPTRAYLVGFDAVALSEGRCDVTARLEQRIAFWFRKAVPAATVRIGDSASLTDEHGLAHACVEARAPFTEHRVRVDDHGWYADEATATTFVFHRARPVVVTDIDKTLADANSFQFLIYPMTAVRPYPGAVESLQELSKRYSIVYLTARDEQLLAKTRRWLAHFEFPRGPVFCRRFAIGNLSAEKYKRELLQRLRLKLPPIAAGIGDREEDARAYAANAIRPILFRQKGRPTGVDGASVIRAWKDILQMIG